jgi:hypothetical protein
MQEEHKFISFAELSFGIGCVVVSKGKSIFVLAEVLPWWICPLQLKVGGHQPKIYVEETEANSSERNPIHFLGRSAVGLT